MAPIARPRSSRSGAQWSPDAIGDRTDVAGWSQVLGLDVAWVATSFSTSGLDLIVGREGTPPLVIPCVDVVSMESLGSGGAGEMTVGMTLRDGRVIRASWPGSFTDHVLDLLRRTTYSDAHQEPGDQPSQVVDTVPVDLADSTASHLREAPGRDAIQVIDLRDGSGPASIAEGHLTIEPVRPGSTRRRLVIAAIATLVLGLTVFSFVLFQRGQGWQRRAVAAEAAVADLSARLESTEAELATTKDELSEALAEVSDLERRVSELTDEKGQIQDERNQWMHVSELGSQSVVALQRCMSDVSDALGAIYAYSYGSYQVLVNRVEASCAAARAKVDQFADAYSSV